MQRQLILALVNDVVLQLITNDIFWLTIFLAAVLIFRRELRAIFGSVGRFKIAGASFELKDKRATLEYYAILSSILIEILSQRDSAEKFVDLLSIRSAQQLVKFSIKYVKEVQQEDTDTELLKNVASIISRWGQTRDAISFYDALLKQKPEDREILNMKGVALLQSNEGENFSKAEDLYNSLIKRYPLEATLWLNRAISKSFLGNFDESLSDLKRAIQLGIRDQAPEWQDYAAIKLLRDAKPQEFEELG